MNLHYDNSITILAMAAFGLLIASTLKGFSPESTMQLAGSAAGRIVLHLVCSWRDHQFRWHWCGIRREFKPAQPTAC